MRSESPETITRGDIEDLNETGEVRGGDEASIATEGKRGDDVAEGGDFGGLGKGLRAEDGEGG